MLVEGNGLPLVDVVSGEVLHQPLRRRVVRHRQLVVVGPRIRILRIGCRISTGVADGLLVGLGIGQSRLRWRVVRVHVLHVWVRRGCSRINVNGQFRVAVFSLQRCCSCQFQF